MDADIIAAFKRRYRTLQIEEPLARDEAEKENIYHVNQLYEMQAQLQVAGDIVIFCLLVRLTACHWQRSTMTTLSTSAMTIS